MMNKPFVHLHVHTEYSLLDGANRCEELAITTKKMGMNSVAITDHGVMYGCYEFYSKCKVIGVNPILGCEVYVEPNGHTCRDSKNQYHLILLAENEEGYHNLTRLVSIGSTEGFYYKPRIDHDLLAKYGKGIIASSACLGGEIPTFIMQGDIVGATARAEMYRDILGKDNFFLEILWVHNEEELKSDTTKPTGLWQRADFNSPNSRFGLCIVNTDETESLFEKAFKYQPAYFPVGLYIDILRNEQNLNLPWTFRLPFKGQKKNDTEPTEHKNGLRNLTKVEFGIKNYNEKDEFINQFEGQEKIKFTFSETNNLTLTFDSNKNGLTREIDELNLKIKY